MAAALQFAAVEQEYSYEYFVAPDVGEDLMAAFYLQAQVEEILPCLFYQEVPKLSTFLAWLQNPRSRYLGCFRRRIQASAKAEGNQREEVAERSQSNRRSAAQPERTASGRCCGAGLAPDGNPTIELCGMGWLWDIGGVPGAMKADCNMAFFRRFQGGRLPSKSTRQMLAYSFETLHLDVLYGGTPSFNRAALLFSRSMGFRQFGPLPKFSSHHGKPCDVVISVMTREEWISRYRGAHDV